MKRDLKLITEAYKHVSGVKPKLLVPDPHGEWMDWLSLNTHKVHKDGSISMFCGFYQDEWRYTQIPVNLKEVKGHILLANLKNLHTLKGLPSTVVGILDLTELPSLWSLEYSPALVEGNVNIAYLSKLQSLKGAPSTVTGNFKLHHLKNLQSLEGSPEYIGGEYVCRDCPKLKSLKGLPPGCKSYEIDGFTQEQIDDYFMGLELKDTATGDPTFDDFFGIGED